MAVDTFIPEIWARAILISLKKALVYGSVVNRNYEGEIAQAGDTVHIASVGSPTISNYVKNVTVISPETLATTDQTLVIDQTKYFAFEVDDVDDRQVAGNVLAEAFSEAAYGLRDVADTHIAGLYTGIDAGNAIGIVSVTTGDLAYAQLVAMKILLDESSVTTEGRWTVVPPWFHGLLLDSAKFIDASASGTTDALVNGHVGRAAGFDIRVSNNVVNSSGDDYEVMAGVNSAITFADQINKVEAYRPHNSFSDAIKGLHLYGSKVVRPTALAGVTASQT